MFHLQEALLLSSLRSQLDHKHVPLYGILHEELGAEEFKEYLKGELFLDKEVRGFTYPHNEGYTLLLFFFTIRKYFMDQMRQGWEYLVSAALPQASTCSCAAMFCASCHS